MGDRQQQLAPWLLAEMRKDYCSHSDVIELIDAYEALAALTGSNDTRPDEHRGWNTCPDQCGCATHGGQYAGPQREHGLQASTAAPCVLRRSGPAGSYACRLPDSHDGPCDWYMVSALPDSFPEERLPVQGLAFDQLVQDCRDEEGAALNHEGRMSPP